MATLFELDQKQFDEWLENRPQVIKDMAAQFPPNKLYRMETGHRVTLMSYSEDRTVVVKVSGKYNYVQFERSVFGVDIDSLIECDLPAPDEKVGVELDQQETEQLLAKLRAKHIAEMN